MLSLISLLFALMPCASADPAATRIVTHKIVEALDRKSKLEFSDRNLVIALTNLRSDQLQKAESGLQYSRELIPIRKWKNIIELVQFESVLIHELVSWYRTNPYLNVFWGEALNTPSGIAARFSITFDATSTPPQSELGALLGPIHDGFQLFPIPPSLDFIKIKIIPVQATDGSTKRFLHLSGLSSQKQNSLTSLKFMTTLIYRLQDQYFEQCASRL